MAAPNSVSYDYDNIATTTLQLTRRRIADTIFKANQTAAFLLNRGRVKTESGGKWIEEPLMYSKNNTIQGYRGYDPLNVAPTEELTMARYNWRQIAGSVAISGLEELQNAGDRAIFNNLRQKIRVLEMSYKEYFDEKIHAATATKDLTRDFLGLEEIIEPAVGSAQGTLGGIDKTANPFWRNQFFDADGETWTRANRDLTGQMINFLNDCTKGLSKTDLIITTQIWYQRYEKENHDLLRLDTNDLGMLKIGFTAQQFKGIPMMWNENCGTDRMYFINTEYLGFTIHRRRNFAMTPFVRPHNQDARTAQMLFAGNMTANNNRFQGVMDLAFGAGSYTD